MKPHRLKIGDTIGIVSPCYKLCLEQIQNAISTLESKGFHIKLAKNVFSDAWDYAGSLEERVEDFNAMIADDEVQMVFFGGGEVGNELLPYIDYDKLAKHPKIIGSFSDGTTLLNAIYCKTGLVTFYGSDPGIFNCLTPYNWNAFENRFMTTQPLYEKSAPWKVIQEGVCTGILIGGYLANFAIMQNNAYFSIDPSKSYLLLLEDHEMFYQPCVLSKYYSHLEQSGIFEHVTGLIMGHYSTKEYPSLDAILRRIGEKYHIPVIQTDDFGHGDNHSVYPFGVTATLDTAQSTLTFLESGVL